MFAVLLLLKIFVNIIVNYYKCLTQEKIKQIKISISREFEFISETLYLFIYKIEGIICILFTY